MKTNAKQILAQTLSGVFKGSSYNASSPKHLMKGGEYGKEENRIWERIFFQTISKHIVQQMNLWIV